MSFSKIESSKAVSENTAKLYKQQLNKLARETTVDTLEGLKSNPSTVIAWVTESTAAIEPVEKRNQARRLRYSAIFWALHGDAFLSQPDNPYRRAFHDADPIQTYDGEVWKKAYHFTD